MQTLGATEKTYREQWMIRIDDERESQGILSAQLDPKISFSFFYGISTFLDYLMPKPSLEKNSSDTI